ncbi:hypothetical protein [Effusibacillus consociatus]|uniref:Lipoprotein n=1 Tax=Effusibacillus consociatus TaxID=1117041 RepID=A0ABV9QAA7_9BACL
MKKSLVIPAILSLAVLAGCGQTADPSQKTTSDIHQHQPAQGGSGGTVDDGKYPVAPDHKNNTKFKDNLLAKKAAPFPGEKASAEEIWKWTNDLEVMYQYAMYGQQSSFTKEQKQALDEWLTQYYGTEFKNKRLQALEPVEGGYRIVNFAKVNDFNAKKEFIQSIDSLDLKTDGKKNLVLTAKLTVDKDQPIEVVYTYGKEDGKWKIVAYNFKLIP